MTLQPDQAGRIGRIGGYAKAAKYPATELTAAARRGFMARFEPRDPDLDPTERQRRAVAAMRAHMAGLAYKSAKARRRTNTIQATDTKDIGHRDRSRMSDGHNLDTSDQLTPEAIRRA